MKRENNAAAEKTEQLVGMRRDASVESGGEIMNTAISKLIFSAHTWPLKWWALTITAAECSVECEIRDENGETKSAHRCDSAEWTKLEGMLAKCDFSAWWEEYEKPVLDGTHWHLEIQYADGRTMESDGMNDCPAEWRNFIAMCKYCERITENASMR